MHSHPLATSLALSLASHLAAQEPPAPPVFRSEAELVIVDAVVTDGKGALVRGLTRDDFVVLEDGVPQAIQTFEAVDRPFLAAAPVPVTDSGVREPVLTANTRARAERATLVVVFDELHLTPASTEQVRRRLDAAWRALGNADVLLVSTAGGGHWLGRLPEDAESLQGALLRFKGMRMPEPSGKLTDYESFLISARHDEPVLIQVFRRYIEAGLIIDPTIKLGDNGGGAGAAIQKSDRKKDLPPIGRAMIAAEAEQRWAAARQRQAATLENLIRLLKGLGGEPGRKAVILVSEGFIHDPAILEHRELVEAARRARAAVHVIDPRNPGALSHEAESVDVIDIRDLHQALARVPRESEGSDALAAATGGRIVRSVVNLPETLGRIGGELRTYYLLGYAPPARRADGRYHKLKVELKKPGLKLEARPGYFAVAPASQRAALEGPRASVMAALASPFDSGGLPVRLASFVLGRGARGGSVVRLVAEVDTAPVGAQGALDATFQLVAQSQGGAWQASVSSPVKAGRGAVRLEQQFEVAPGAYQARLVVRERGGEARIGSVRHAITVQPLDAFRMTTPILTDVLVPPGEAPLPRAERRFAQGATLHCLVEVMGGSGQPVRAGVEVQSADGTPLRQIADAPIASVPPSRRWSIPLAGLEAGSYQLIISVKDDGKGQALTRREPFEIFGPSGSAD